ncbi:MAG TPA: response regulator transcription factor [Flavobacteriales bacterium]|jgi:two-component system LytT family response regulator|nr:LytTR family DNA-binding domain-containing protein [Flavobacteriales bacterium]HIK68121.1 response regulator transcription factor [Flavobacteriales bacterium]
MRRNLNVLVVDDEAPARALLCRQIENICPSLNVVATASSAAEARSYIDNFSPDVVFLDIQMPYETGLELIETYQDRDFYVVFATSFNEYAIKALRQRAFDFLLKPIDNDDLKACARRILMHYYHKRKPGQGALPPAPRRFEIVTLGKRHFVKHDDIQHIEACGSYATLHLISGRRITISKNLKKVELILDDPTFFRIHNSHIVRLNYIHTCNYRSHSITLESGKKIPMAVRKREELKQRMHILISS